MKSVFTVFILMAYAWGATLSAQAPYIIDNTGLGQYGYLEVDATTTTSMSSNTYSTRGLAARWWTGAEYIYYPSSNPGCGVQDFTVGDYSSANHANWFAGTIAYVSVRFRGCDNNWNGSNNNERQFRLVNVTDYTAYTGSFDNQVTDNPTGTENMVGSFTINAGAALTLDRLWLTNLGSAQETTDIPGSGITVYYEPITGSEQYDGTESSVALSGGVSSSDEIWGSDNLNIPMTAVGIRCYLVVNDIASTMTPNNTVQFQIINDGISFEQFLDGKNLLRVNTVTTAPSAVPLPVQLVGFDGKYRDGKVKLQWQTASEQNFHYFDVEHSTNSNQWTALEKVYGNVSTAAIKSYSFEHLHPAEGNNYYRLKIVDLDGQYTYSNIVRVIARMRATVEVGPNPVTRGIINIQFEQADERPVLLRLYDVQGKLVRNVQLPSLDQRTVSLEVGDLLSGTYYLQIDDLEATKVVIP